MDLDTDLGSVCLCGFFCTSKLLPVQGENFIAGVPENFAVFWGPFKGRVGLKEGVVVETLANLLTNARISKTSWGSQWRS